MPAPGRLNMAFPRISSGLVPKITRVLEKACPYRPPIPRLYELMRALVLSSRDPPWEVVECKSVQSVPTFYDDEDVDILRVSSSEIHRTYVFEHESGGDSNRIDTVRTSRRSLIFARQRLLEEIAKNNYNVLLREGWRVTVFRKGIRQRIEVKYVGRGALATVRSGMTQRKPPFIELLYSS